MIEHLWYRKVCFHFYFCEKTLIKEANVSVRLRPFFEAVFAFYFALALGTLGRMHDFICDMILGLNMQKTYVADRTALIDTAVLYTVEILIVDGVAAAIVAVVGYKGNKRENLKAKTIHEARGSA